MAGHERKHNTCRADIGGCVSGYTYINRAVVLLLVRPFESAPLGLTVLSSTSNLTAYVCRDNDVQRDALLNRMEDQDARLRAMYAAG